MNDKNSSLSKVYLLLKQSVNTFCKITKYFIYIKYNREKVRGRAESDELADDGEVISEE